MAIVILSSFPFTSLPWWSKLLRETSLQALTQLEHRLNTSLYVIAFILLFLDLIILVCK